MPGTRQLYRCEGCPAEAVAQHFAASRDLDPSEVGLILFHIVQRRSRELFEKEAPTDEVLEDLGEWAPDYQSPEPINGGISRKEIAMDAMACGLRCATGNCGLDEL